MIGLLRISGQPPQRLKHSKVGQWNDGESPGGGGTMEVKPPPPLPPPVPAGVTIVVSTTTAPVTKVNKIIGLGVQTGDDRTYRHMDSRTMRMNSAN